MLTRQPRAQWSSARRQDAAAILVAISFSWQSPRSIRAKLEEHPPKVEDQNEGRQLLEKVRNWRSALLSARTPPDARVSKVLRTCGVSDPSKLPNKLPAGKASEFELSFIGSVAEPVQEIKEPAIEDVNLLELMAKLVEKAFFQTVFGKILAEKILTSLVDGRWPEPIRRLPDARPTDVHAVDPPGRGSCGYLAVHNALQLPFPAETLEILANSFIDHDTVRGVIIDHFKDKQTLLDSLGSINAQSSLTPLGLPWADLHPLSNFTRFFKRRFAYCRKDRLGEVQVAVVQIPGTSGEPDVSLPPLTADTPLGILVFSDALLHYKNIYVGGLPRVPKRIIDSASFRKLLKDKWHHIFPRFEDGESFATLMKDCQDLCRDLFRFIVKARRPSHPQLG